MNRPELLENVTLADLGDLLRTATAAPAELAAHVATLLPTLDTDDQATVTVWVRGLACHRHLDIGARHRGTVRIALHHPHGLPPQAA